MIEDEVHSEQARVILLLGAQARPGLAVGGGLPISYDPIGAFLPLWSAAMMLGAAAGKANQYRQYSHESFHAASRTKTSVSLL